MDRKQDENENNDTLESTSAHMRCPELEANADSLLAVAPPQDALECRLDGEGPWCWICVWGEEELAENAWIVEQLTKDGEKGWVVV